MPESLMLFDVQFIKVWNDLATIDNTLTVQNEISLYPGLYDKGRSFPSGRSGASLFTYEKINVH